MDHLLSTFSRLRSRYGQGAHPPKLSQSTMWPAARRARAKHTASFNTFKGLGILWKALRSFAMLLKTWRGRRSCRTSGAGKA